MAALDHWVTREIVDRAVSLAENPEADSAGSLPGSAGQSQWNRESLFQQIEKTCTPDVANLLTAVYRQAEGHPAFAGFYFGEGKNPSVTAWFNVGENESAAIWSIYTDEKKSVLAVNFQWMRDRRALAKRLAPLAETLSRLPGLHDLPRSLVAKNYMRRPSLGVPTLSAPDAQEVFLRAFDDLLSPRKRRLF